MLPFLAGSTTPFSNFRYCHVVGFYSVSLPAFKGERYPAHVLDHLESSSRTSVDRARHDTPRVSAKNGAALSIAEIAVRIYRPRQYILRCALMHTTSDSFDMALFLSHTCLAYSNGGTTIFCRIAVLIGVSRRWSDTKILALMRQNPPRAFHFSFCFWDKLETYPPVSATTAIPGGFRTPPLSCSLRAENMRLKALDSGPYVGMKEKHSTYNV